jgi:hypothetical protein
VGEGRVSNYCGTLWRSDPQGSVQGEHANFRLLSSTTFALQKEQATNTVAWLPTLDFPDTNLTEPY